MSELKIYPAIDLLEGACVRLVRGAFDAVTSYDRDPLSVARSYAAAGARYLHVVDLDGAKAQLPKQRSVIEAIASETALELQVGGGIRSGEAARAYLDAGASRIVIGTLAVLDPEATLAIIRDVGANRVTLAFDFVRQLDGELWPAIRAWTELRPLTLGKLFAPYAAISGLVYLCTDISRDGGLTGIDGSFYETLQSAAPGAAILASGGIATLDDVHLVRSLNLEGAIVGKALYERAFTLEEALSC